MNIYLNVCKQIIIIIIMSCRQHGYPWSSLATSPYHSSPPAGLQGYILCPHIVAVCKFVLVVLLLHIHMWVPQEYIAYELVLASPAVSRVSGSSNLYSFRYGGGASVRIVGVSWGVVARTLFNTALNILV